MSTRREAQAWIHAYHDGELGWLGRRRAERRLRRDADARRELEELAALRTVVCDVEAEAAAPDVWGALAGRLRAVDAELEADAAPARPQGLPGWLRPAAAGVALAALVAVVTVLVAPQEPVSVGMVRWLDTQGQPFMVFEEADEPTIIWVMEPANDEIGRGGIRAFI